MIPQVGQIMFLAYTERRKQGMEHEIVVTKVGRKWVTFQRKAIPSELRSHFCEDRFDMSDPRFPVDGRGFSSEARIWPTRKAWEAEKERNYVYMALREAVHRTYDLSPDVSAENVRAAVCLLGLTKLAQEAIMRGLPS